MNIALVACSDNPEILWNCFSTLLCKSSNKKQEMREVFTRKNRYIRPRYLLAACLR